MHGDRVLASVTGMDRRGRREGAIVEVLERRLNRLIGRFEIESGISYVVPDDRRIQRNVHIPPDARGDAKHGQLVVVELTQAPDSWRPPIGRVLTVLGERLTASLAVQAAIHGHELPHEFPQAVLGEAAAVPLTVDAATAAERVDLRATAAGHHRRRGCQGLRRRGLLRTQPRRFPSDRRDRRCFELRPSRRTAGRRGAEAGDLGVLSRASSCRCCRRPCPTASAR